MLIQIPGFGEKPEEWIVDQIVTHHGKGLGSEFQIQWKAGDRTWASYREVAHLNALDRYCELMGVNDASGLPGNYVNDPDSDKGDEENIIQARACTLTDFDKRDEDSTTNGTYSSTDPLYPTSNDMHSTISINELRTCLDYEHALNASRVGICSPPNGPPPARWDDYLREQEARIAAQRPIVNHPIHQRSPAYSPIPDNVYMPADTLEVIIRAIGNASRPNPTSIFRPPFPNRHTPRRPPPPPPVIKNKGGNANANRGKGPNKRGKRGERTKDPRRNNAPINQAPNQASTSSSSPPSISAPIAAVTVIPDPSNLTSLEQHEDEGLSFLNEFASHGMPSNEDVLMHGDIPTEGDFGI